MKCLLLFPICNVYSESELVLFEPNTKLKSFLILLDTPNETTAPDISSVFSVYPADI